MENDKSAKGMRDIEILGMDINSFIFIQWCKGEIHNEFIYVASTPWTLNYRP